MLGGGGGGSSQDLELMSMRSLESALSHFALLSLFSVL